MSFDFDQALEQRLKWAVKGFEQMVANGNLDNPKAIFEEGLMAGVMAYESVRQIQKHLEQQNNER